LEDTEVRLGILVLAQLHLQFPIHQWNFNLL